MFIHLRVHTEYSLQDSTLRIKEMVKKAKEFGMTHLALTDHHAMYGAFLFEQECKKAGITPIFGVDLIVDGYPMVLLAETQKGYANLVQLVTYANSVGKLPKENLPHITQEKLVDYAEGLIAISGGVPGKVSQLLLEGKEKEAKAFVQQMTDLFGKENFFLEITIHGLPEEEKLQKLLPRLSESTQIPLVATNDVHYLVPEHAYARAVFNQLQGDVLPKWEDHTSFSNQFHFASSEEMEEVFADYPHAIELTLTIAKRCEGVEIPRERALPNFPVPAPYTLDQYFEKVAWDGFHKRFPHNPSQVYIERMEYEIKTIIEMGFPGYFLIVWDFIDYAKYKADIAVGPGRGSAAGSLVAYCLEITDRLDPIEHDLLFERFLNPYRITMPDVDIDFDFEDRQKMIEYVQNKYGHDRVAQIITFGTLGTKSVFRDFGRLLGFTYKETEEMSNEIDKESLAEAKELPYFQERLTVDERFQKLFELGAVVEGLPRHTSVHAAGVVIGRMPLQNYVPLKEEDGTMITMWDMSQVEDIGLLKMDFLGLKTLTVLKYAYRNVKETKGIQMSSSDIPWNDAKTFELLRQGATGRVFQLESGGMQKTLRDLQPTSFDDIVAVLSLYRPGPMQFIPDYIQNKQEGKFQVLHPVLEPILKPTHGIMVYQEQIQRVAQQLAGYTLGEADLLRRAVGKKKAEVLAAERKNFVEKAITQGVDEKVANAVYDQIVLFADYGFNKSHAAAYSVVSYDTAYMKAHYPHEFMAANLTVAIGDSKKLVAIFSEVKRMGIEILPPHLEKSREIFSVEQKSDGTKAIRYGLKGIRNVGSKLAEHIVKCPAFDNLLDYLIEIPSHIYTKASWENLISAGACDHLSNRGTLLHNLADLSDFAKERQEIRKRGQLSFFDLGVVESAPLPIMPDTPKIDMLKEERRVLEVAISGHPLDACQDLVTPFVSGSIAEIDEYANGDRWTIAGVFSDIKTIITKKGQKMAFATLEDQTSEMEVILFPQTYKEIQEHIKAFVPILVTGKIEWDKKEERAKLIVDTIKPILSGRKVLYLRVKNEEHLNGIRETLVSHNGVTSVIFYLEEQKKLVPQSFKIRMNQETFEKLASENYHLV